MTKNSYNGISGLRLCLEEKIARSANASGLPAAGSYPESGPTRGGHDAGSPISARAFLTRKVFGLYVVLSNLESRRLKGPENEWAASPKDRNACAANPARRSVQPQEGGRHA